jgi:gluconolactonase
MRLTAWDPSVADLFAEMDADGPRVAQVATGLRFTEGPVWVPHLPGGAGLLFSDIPADTIYLFRPGGGAPSVWRRPSGQSNGMTLDTRGRLLVCEHRRRRLSRSEVSGAGEYGGDPVALATQHGGRRLNSPNDVVVRSDGTVYFTDPTYGLGGAPEEQTARRVYRIPAEAAEGPLPAEPLPAAEGFTQPNGLAFSPDERVLYVDDSAEGNLRAFEVAPDGALRGGRVLFVFDRGLGPGNPDGLKVDVAGNIWVTGPGGLWILAPDGRPRGHLAFPEVTANLNWADEDRRTLYVTASRSLYRLRVRLPGAGVAPA